MNVVDQLLANGPSVVDARDGSLVGPAGLHARICAWRRSLDAAGCAPGDKVAVQVDDPVEFVAAHLAVVGAGAASIPLSSRLPEPERARLLDAVGPDLRVDDSSRPSEPCAEERMPVVQRDAGDPAVILFTSGTDGEPRPVLLTHRHLVYSLAAIRTLGIDLGVDDGFGLVVPADHVLGLTGILHLGLAIGGRVVVGLPADPGSLLAALAEHEVTVLAGPPTLWHDLVTHEAGGTPAERLGPVRIALSGAAPLDRGLSDRFSERFGLVLHQAYGLTESAGVGATTLGAGPDAVELARSGSVGRPLPGVEVRLVDRQGNDVLVGDPGEILLRGPTVVAGELDEWLHTGDLGVVDVTGALAVVDRLKDLIIVSGFNVHPAEVEAVLRTAPGVADAAVLSRPDARTTERVEARLVAREGERIDTAEVRRHCSAHLARYKVPTEIEVVDRLPVSVMGKLRRRELR